MRASRFWRAISRLRDVLEGSIKAQIEGLDVNFHISNEGVYTLDVELICSFKITEKMQFSQWKKNVFEEPYLDLEMSYKSIKAQIKVLKVNFHNAS